MVLIRAAWCFQYVPLTGQFMGMRALAGVLSLQPASQRGGGRRGERKREGDGRRQRRLCSSDGSAEAELCGPALSPLSLCMREPGTLTAEA